MAPPTTKTAAKTPAPPPLSVFYTFPSITFAISILLKSNLEASLIK